MQRFAPHFALRFAAFSVLAAAIVFLSGCANMTGTALPPSVTVSAFSGSLHGGQQPILGARVYLFAANLTGGYASASQSLITGGAGTDEVGGYVLSDANGAFFYGGTFECPTPTSQIYLLALGGNPTGTPDGPENTAIALSAAIGSCSSINASTFTIVNEVSTVAMVYAVHSFMTDATHVGAPATNSSGLLNAFPTASNLVDLTTGFARTTTASGQGIAPQQTVNTLANIIAACVNSASEASTACTQLFSFSTSSGTGTPSDTIGALINIAGFPGTQTASLYGLSSPFAPFQPSLVTQPNDFALGLTYSPVGLTAVQPSTVVIDGAGNIWMANCQSCLNPTAPDSLLEFSPNGVFLHSFTGSAVPGVQVLHGIKGIALDASGLNIYTINQGIPGGPAGGVGDDQMVKMNTSTGTLQGGFPIDFDQATYGVDTFNGIALDNSGEIWATATNTGAIIQANPGGNLINGSPFFIGGTLGVATDNIGNIWFAGIGGNNIIQFDTNGDFLQNFTPAGLNQPYGMAINGSNELLTINQASQSISKVEFFNGNNGPGSPYSNIGIFQATTIAVDGENQMVVPNCRASCPSSGSNQPDNILRLSQTGVPNTGGTAANFGAAIPNMAGPTGAAIDSSGNVWVANNISGTLTQVISFAAPTTQPLALASANGRIGQLP